jgi:YVTN family beta-propeller protein
VSITVTKLAIVTNGNSQTVSVIDVSTSSVVTTLTVGGFPVGASVTPDGKLGVVARPCVVSCSAADGDLRLIDLTTNPPALLPGAITVTGVGQPQSTAISPNGKFALVMGGQTDAVSVDLVTGNTVSSVPAGMNLWAGAITPDGSLALVVDPFANKVAVFTMSSANGVLADTGQRITLSASNAYPMSIAVTPNGHLALVTHGGPGTTGFVDVLSITSSGIVTQTGSVTSLGTNTKGVAITPDGSKAYVSSFDSSDVAVLSIDVTLNTVSDTSTRIAITSGTQDAPFGVSGIAVTPDGTKLYVTGPTGTISIVNTADDTLLGTTISVGAAPHGIGMPQ